MRRELPAKRGFNQVTGEEGLSTTALYDFLQERVEHPDDTPKMREHDRNYYASQPIEVVFDIDGKSYAMRVTNAGFSCIDPCLMLRGEVL